jgi:DNA-directed RNA polymerase specialized sigma subunit
VARYLDNPSFSRQLGLWAAAKRQAILTGTKHPPMPDSVAEGIMLIADHYSNRCNFYRYTYIDDMRSEAVLGCIKYCHNFDLDKTNNGHSYCTTLIHHSFIRAIQTESQQTYIKAKFLRDNTTRSHNLQRLIDSGDTIIDAFETKKRKRLDRQNERRKEKAA